MFPESVLSAAPHAPGVYLMMDNKSAVLYVGKAKDLFKRLSSYARYSGAEHNKTVIMLQKVKKVDTILTNTEKEALILESSLIKKHKPKYNILLRDDKNYPYIKVTTQEQWPQAIMARRKSRDKARYFGPYSSSSAMWSTLRLITTLFPLRKCKGLELKKRDRPCLNFQIGRCLAPCVGATSRELYMSHVNNIIMLLEGRNRDLVRNLEQEMHVAAEELDFEKAALVRDQLAAVSKTLEKQIISAEHGKDQDVFGFARHGNSVVIAILFIRDGLLNGNRTFFLEDPLGEDSWIISQAISQFYDHQSYIPKDILLPFEPADVEILAEYLGELAESKICLQVPQRGDKHNLVSMANTNAQQRFEEQERKTKSWESLGMSLAKVLHLDRVPERIECLDISNIGGKQAVGSLVCFSHGEADKKSYRHYRIRTLDSPNDYGMMKEVLERRLKRGLEENNLPDLFIVDGGKGQLGMAMEVAGELGITDDLNWIGIAKERQEEGEKLYKPGRKNPIILPAHSPVLLYLMRIRDESHRYGITLHRKLRNKATLTSELDAIPGVGAEKKKALLRHLGSLKRIREAEVSELQEVQGIGKELATQIFTYFHSVEKQ